MKTTLATLASALFIAGTASAQDTAPQLSDADICVEEFVSGKVNENLNYAGGESGMIKLTYDFDNVASTCSSNTGTDLEAYKDLKGVSVGIGYLTIELN